MKQNIHFVSKPKGHIQLVINMKTTDYGGFSVFKIRPVHQSLYYTTLEIGNENSPPYNIYITGRNGENFREDPHGRVFLMYQLRLIFKVDLPICVEKGAFFVSGKGNRGEILSEIISTYAGYSAGHRIEHYTSRLEP